MTAALQLSEKQKNEIVELLDKRQAEFDADSDVNEDAINGKYELMIKRIFQPTQLAAWRVMTLEVAGEMPKIAVEAEVAVAPADDTSKAVAEADSIKITFSFGQMDWEPLIEWFAEQGAEIVELEVPNMDVLLRDSDVLSIEFPPDLERYLATFGAEEISSLEQVIERGLFHQAVSGVLRYSASLNVSDSDYQSRLSMRSQLRAAMVYLLGLLAATRAARRSEPIA